MRQTAYQNQRRFLKKINIHHREKFDAETTIQFASRRRNLSRIHAHTTNLSGAPTSDLHACAPLSLLWMICVCMYIMDMGARICSQSHDLSMSKEIVKIRVSADP